MEPIEGTPKQRKRRTEVRMPIDPGADQASQRG